MLFFPIFFMGLALIISYTAKVLSAHFLQWLAVWVFIFSISGKWKKLILPFALLIPLPSIWIEKISFELRIISAKLAGIFLTPFLENISVRGTSVYWNGNSVEVIAACSGANTAYAMVVISCILALIEKRFLHKFSWLLLALPLAISANAIRIGVIALLIANGKESWALGDAHEWIGIAVFFVFLSLLIRTLGLPDFPKVPSFKLLNPWKSAALLFSTLLFCLWTFTPIKTEKQKLLPLEMRPIPSWSYTKEPLPESDLALLKASDAMFWRYSKNKQWVLLYIVRSNVPGRGIHPPDLCYRGDGFEKMENSTVLWTVNTERLSVTRNVFENARGQKELVFHWWQIGKFVTNQEWKAALIALTHPHDSVVMIRISTVVGRASTAKDSANAAMESAEKLISNFLKEAEAAGYNFSQFSATPKSTVSGTEI